eukprot:scaffold200884_cov27-Prasinocladus_malaysianus.AAC.1
MTIMNTAKISRAVAFTAGWLPAKCILRVMKATNRHRQQSVCPDGPTCHLERPGPIYRGGLLPALLGRPGLPLAIPRPLLGRCCYRSGRVVAIHFVLPVAVEPVCRPLLLPPATVGCKNMVLFRVQS